MLSLTKENIKEIYEKFNKFHIFSKIQKLLKDDNITEKELNEYLSIRPTYMLKLEENYRPWGTKPLESREEIVNNITPYTKLDEALYCLTTNPNFNYRDNYIHYSDGNEYGINTWHPRNEKLAILMFKYLSQENNVAVSLEVLNELKAEIKFFATLENPNQFKFESSILNFLDESNSIELTGNVI
ncbi:MAG: hypothetical protein RCO49_06465 [Rickettsia endosymbiont of Argas persicus]